jgi:hypothetical protein
MFVPPQPVPVHSRRQVGATSLARAKDAPACRRSATPDRISKTAPVGPAARARPRARPPPVSSPPRSARRCSGVTACHGPPERPERSADASVRPAACHLPRPATAPYLRMRRESPHRQTPAQTQAKNGRIGIDSNRETSKILTFVERVSSVCGETEGPTEGARLIRAPHCRHGPRAEAWALQTKGNPRHLRKTRIRSKAGTLC